ncbi:MAG: hypothetical protein JNJ54_02860 [Myxococcaceae bacterium]|nr:hypothetical protein [Myxococcaceae bacterium]
MSATNLGGLVKALAAEGLFDQLTAKLSPGTLAVLQNPHGRRWHPGTIALETWGAIIDVAGGPKFEALNLRITRDSFGPIVRPMLKVVLALGGSSPATLFSRLDDTIKVATKGLRATWTPAGKNGGTVVFEYPCPVPRADVVEYGWRGALRFGDELTGKPLAFGPVERRSDRAFAFPVTW